MPNPGRPRGQSPGTWPSYTSSGVGGSLAGAGPLQLRQVAQVPEREDPRCVATGKADLERVLPDQAYIRDLQLVLPQLDDPVQPPGYPRLATALRAGTGPPQLPARIACPDTILPDDLENVVGSNQVYCGGKRVRISQRMLITGSRRNDWIDVLAAIWDATSANALAAGESGRETTIGAPLSDSTRMSSARGSAPRNGTPSRRAARSAPPWPNTWCSWPHSGQTYQLMFSISPRGVTLSERNICSALTAMSR